MSGEPKRVLVLTGSGISAESGIPTFRGAGGYWRNLDPKQLATATAFQEAPDLVWQWYRERRELIRRAQPNAAHIALVKLAAQSGEFLLLTQNVDDLHTRAEWDGRRLAGEQVVQIHGDIFVTRCSRCAYRRSEREHESQAVPQCPQCGAALRPGVVWFDEQLDQGEVRRVTEFLKPGPCEAVLVIGTTAVFDYIVDWTLSARGSTGRLIEVNPEETPLSAYATKRIPKPAAESVQEWLKEMTSRQT